MDYLAQFGTVAPPPGPNKFAGGGIGGLALFINVILRSLIMIAGIYVVINFIVAGYDYISAGADPDKIKRATQRIWQSVIGVVIVGGALTLAALVGMLFFGDAGALIDLKIFTP